MNLREQLRSILPDILPGDPEQAIKGTELIRLVRLRLGDDYSDATLRYHFSILSYDPTSPIAKVDQGQGYYQREKKNVSSLRTARLGLFGGPESDADLAIMRFERLTAIFERLCYLRARHSFVLNGHETSLLDPRGYWDIPDVVTAEWDLETGSDEVSRFDSGMMKLRSHLGGPAVNLSGVQLKLSVTLDSYMADFFQALSASRWALQSELIIAEGLNDEALVDALRSLGHQFGVGISSLGISLAQLDDLPMAAELRAMSAAEFEAVQSQLRIQKITLAPARHAIDWQALSALRKKHEPVAELVRWLSECLERQQPERSK